MGLIYDQGEFVPKNSQLAAKFYRQAADQGDAAAQNNLGLLYNRYFPSLADSEKRAEKAGSAFLRTNIRKISSTASVTPLLIRTVEERNYSMFRLLGEQKYTAGLEKMRHDLGAEFGNGDAGETLIRFEKASFPR